MLRCVAVEPGVPDPGARSQASGVVPDLDVPGRTVWFAPRHGAVALLGPALHPAPRWIGDGGPAAVDEPAGSFQRRQGVVRLGGCRCDEGVGEGGEDLGGDEFAELGVPARLAAGGLGPQPPPRGGGGLRVELQAVTVIGAAQDDLGAERVGGGSPSGGGQAVGDVAGVSGAGEVAGAGVERDPPGVLVGEGGELPFVQRHEPHSGSVATALPYRPRRPSRT